MWFAIYVQTAIMYRILQLLQHIVGAWSVRLTIFHSAKGFVLIIVFLMIIDQLCH